MAALLLLQLLLGPSHAAEPPPPGSDPTGRTDSSAALNAAVRALCEATAAAPAPRDAVLDLAGGVYLMDAPLAVNSSLRCSGMLRIRSGTLLASEALGRLGANHSFLVTVLDYWEGLGVSLEQLVFASDSHGGGLRVDAAHHVHVADSNFLNFATVGIWGSKLLGMGHDLAVDRCRLTECTGDMHLCADIGVKKATAIHMEFPDSHFRNTVITCGRAGIVNRAGANTFHQLHIWTSCTGDAPCGANTTIGFSEEAGGSRITDSYFDNSVLRVSGFRGTTIANNLFNGCARLEIAEPAHVKGKINTESPDCQYWDGAVCNLLVTGNQMLCAPCATCGRNCATINTTYMIPAASDVHVHSNAFEGPNTSVCSQRSSCMGEEDCRALLGPCDPAAPGWNNQPVGAFSRLKADDGDSSCDFVQPPMGWNSYDSQVGLTNGNGGQGEAVALESAQFVAKNLAHLGYEYVVLDAGWFGDNGGSSMTVDAHGRLMPNTTLHPSSANGKGFGPLSEKVRALGLKFGFWIMGGIPRKAVGQTPPLQIKGSNYTVDEAADLTNKRNCGWQPGFVYGTRTISNGSALHPAAVAYYDSVARLYKQWDVAFVKMDW